MSLAIMVPAFQQLYWFPHSNNLKSEHRVRGALLIAGTLIIPEPATVLLVSIAIVVVIGYLCLRCNPSVQPAYARTVLHQHSAISHARTLTRRNPRIHEPL